ncbi:MAG: AAA family ATPase [Marinifilaceae bacterium]|jgi:predicted AAA+ superfamily ATPase|nr:AAA family ATPase [Marinifilaceae bacterium]
MHNLYKTHISLLNTNKGTIRRELIDIIDWNHRLIAIKGSRGVGKTTFLLDYIREKHHDDKTCLFINLNNLFFTERGLVSFVDEFYKKGGKVLLLDQIHKYPDWDIDLKTCYEKYEDLQIIFTASSILRIKGNAELADLVKVYYLNGLSFREFINQQTQNKFRAYSLSEIMQNHEQIVDDILDKIRPLAYFQDYLQYGYYPSYLENKTYNDTILKIINLMLEFDITYLNQIELKYLPKLKRLLYLIASNAPLQPNVSKLANSVETSRATIMNYLRYLQNARLIHLLASRNEEKDSSKKPSKLYLNNTNLLYAISPDNVNKQHLCETFFYNQIHGGRIVTDAQNGEFTVDKEYIFKISEQEIDDDFRKSNNQFIASDMIEKGKGNQIPLWLFGFMY